MAVLKVRFLLMFLIPFCFLPFLVQAQATLVTTSAVISGSASTHGKSDYQGQSVIDAIRNVGVNAATYWDHQPSEDEAWWAMGHAVASGSLNAGAASGTDHISLQLCSYARTDCKDGGCTSAAASTSSAGSFSIHTDPNGNPNALVTVTARYNNGCDSNGLHCFGDCHFGGASVAVSGESLSSYIGYSTCKEGCGADVEERSDSFIVRDGDVLNFSAGVSGSASDIGVLNACIGIDIIVSAAASPTAAFTTDTEAPGYTELVTFDASSSSPSDPSGKITEYTWDFGKKLVSGLQDIETTTSPKIQRAFTRAGRYTVKLVVKDNQGRTAEKKREIAVSDQCQPPGYLRNINPIDEFCDPHTENKPIRVNWGQKKPTKGPSLEFNSGQRLDVACRSGQFHMYFTSLPQFSQEVVGTCPFVSGFNTMRYFDSGDQIDEDGKPLPDAKPDCLYQTSWTSRDYGCNDDRDNFSYLAPDGMMKESCSGPWLGYNAWTRESRIVEPESEPRIDWAIIDFNANSKSVSKWDEKWNIRRGTKEPFDKSPSPEAYDPASSRYPVSRTADPPLGPETRAFFDRLTADLQAHLAKYGVTLTGDLAMSVGWNAACDLTLDGICDQRDQEAFQNILGLCYADPGYHPDADADRDGCITLDDAFYLFQQDSDEDSIPNSGDSCPAADERSSVIIGGCDSAVNNLTTQSGCSISQQIDVCMENAPTHGDFVSCVAQDTKELLKTKLISNAQKDAIQSCAAQAAIPAGGK